jgi:hypothetical protein
LARWARNAEKDFSHNFKAAQKWMKGSMVIPGPYDEIGRRIAELPRPRPVRMSARGKMMAAIVSVALLSSFAAYAAADLVMRRNARIPYAGPSQFPIFVLSIVFILIATIVMANVIGRQKQLLADGEMCMARVVDRVLARNGPNIRYDFTTALGEHLSGSSQDGSRKLSIGMCVPVFYEAQDPSKQLALCASFYEVILPDSE